MYYMTNYDSPIGQLTLASDGVHLVGLWMKDQKYFGGAIKLELASGKVVPEDKLPVFCTVKGWLDHYFAGEKPEIMELPLSPAGSDFRQEVWKLLCEIPYGEVTTYGAIAAKMAEKLQKKTMSAQAVGGAVGHNPISIIIPCHRLVGANGSLTGYAGGVEKKIRLLELEGVDVSVFTVPGKGILNEKRQ